MHGILIRLTNHNPHNLNEKMEYAWHADKISQPQLAQFNEKMQNMAP